MPQEQELFRWLLIQVQDILRAKDKPENILKLVCAKLREHVTHYNWVGFYLVSPVKARTLTLGPYVGDATDHVEIPFGRGICGQVAESLKPMIAGDVTKVENYLACSLKVKAEIVVPIFDEAKNFIAQLDIDSHVVNPFTNDDWIFLEHVGRMCRSMLLALLQELR